MPRLLVPLAALLVVLLDAQLQAAPPPKIAIEARHPRSTVPIPGWLDGPVAIDERGRIDFLTDDGVLGQLEPDGRLRWAYLVGPRGGQPALAADGTIYTAGCDGRLYAVDPDGRPLWTGLLDGRPVRGAAVGPDAVAVALDTGRLELWRPDGRLLARVALGGVPSAAVVLIGPARAVVPLASGEIVAIGGPRVAWRARVAAGAVGALAVDAGGALLAGAADGSVARILADGTLAWRTNVGAPVSRSPVLTADGTVLVAAGSLLVAITPSGGLRWRRRLAGTIAAGPLVADDGSIYVAFAPARGGAGRILAMDPNGLTHATIALPAAPMRGLDLSGGMLWLGLGDLTLRRFAVPQGGLARSSWAKARGDRNNAGSLR